MTLPALMTKAKIGQLYFHKIKNFCVLGHHQESGKTTHRMGGKYSQNMYLMKDLCPDYMKNINNSTLKI